MYLDNDRGIAWILRCYVKKTNALNQAIVIAVNGAVSAIEADISRWKKAQAKLATRAIYDVLKGDKK